MTQLSDILQINITRSDTAVAQTNFNTPLFISAHTKFPERARTYANLIAVGSDFSTTDTAYIAAQKFFGQTLVPQNIVLGRRQVPGATLDITAVSAGTTYTITINEIPFTYTPTGSPTATTIMTALATAYLVTPVAGVVFTDNLDGTATLSSTVDWSLTTSVNISQANQPATETWTTSIQNVQAANSAWYAATIESHLTADVLAVAAYIEATTKIFGTSSQSADIKTSVTTDLFSQLKALGYQRTFGIWSATADTQFPECALIGYELQEQPGASTWAYKTLAGVTVSTLSETESTNILGKSATTYETVGGVNSTIGAKMFGGEWIDVMVFVDWLQAQLTSRLWFRMVNSKKIPYTAAGATIIESDIRSVLNAGIVAGGLADTPAPTVSVPDVLTVNPNNRALRIFDGITFQARLAGAIHFLDIAGNVSV
jgi:hypothetical protein